MASGANGFKQTNGYFVPLGDCVPKMLHYKDAGGAGGSFLPGQFTLADWVNPASTKNAGAVLSTISSVGAGGLLKDMGKTVVSSNRTFRKVQLVCPSLNGSANLVKSGEGPFYTAYIELSTGLNLGVGATPAPAPVAYMPGLM